jgi:hypothetical protein
VQRSHDLATASAMSLSVVSSMLQKPLQQLLKDLTSRALEITALLSLVMEVQFAIARRHHQ